MRIYIDESGNFVAPQDNRSSYSLVLALIVPSASGEQLFYEFLRLRDSWSKHEIEMKGSSLSEAQAAQVINLLARFDVLVDFVALDIATHPKEVIDDFKSRQAEAVTAHITREHHSEMVLQMVQMERTIRNMSNQLFTQAELTIQLVLKVIRNATLYFVQRQPEELGEIAWIVDRKGHTITQMEETWTILLLPAAESHFMKTPFISLIGADYSHFAHYEVDLASDEDMARHLDWAHAAYGRQEKLPREGRVIDAKRVLTGQQTFSDSRDSLGLQLADILASILRRALNSRLQPSGWEDFGKLVVHSKDSGWFVQLGKGLAPTSPQGNVTNVWHALNSRSKPMIDKAFEHNKGKARD